MTNEHKTLARAASFGAPAAHTNAGFAMQRQMIKDGLIKSAGCKQNSMTDRYGITEAGIYRLFELEA